MRLLRGLLGGLLWILAAVVGLVAVVLCITVILLPLGIPLLAQARRMFTSSVRLMLPPAVAHPVKTMDKNGRKKGKAVTSGRGRRGGNAVEEGAEVREGRRQGHEEEDHEES